MRRPILALFIAPTIVAAVQAVAAGSIPTHPQTTSQSAACEAARLAAWFDAQRQLTDGNVAQTKPTAEPDECIRSDGHARAAYRIPGDYRIGAALPTHAEQEREPMPSRDIADYP